MGPTSVGFWMRLLTIVVQWAAGDCKPIGFFHVTSSGRSRKKQKKSMAWKLVTGDKSLLAFFKKVISQSTSKFTAFLQFSPHHCVHSPAGLPILLFRFLC